MQTHNEGAVESWNVKWRSRSARDAQPQECANRFRQFSVRGMFPARTPLRGAEEPRASRHTLFGASLAPAPKALKVYR